MQEINKLDNNTHKQNKTEEIMKVLRENKGYAYTIADLHDITKLNKTYIRMVLDKKKQSGKVERKHHEGTTHYFFIN